MGIEGKALFRVVSVLFFLASVAISVPGQVQKPVATGASPLASDSEAVRRLVDLTNRERAQYKLRPLKTDSRLEECARWMAEDMARHGYFDHKDRFGRLVDARVTSVGFTWRAVGENLAGGQTTPEEAVSDWMKSPGHRRNILDSDFREVGMACVRLPSSEYRIYWVQVFAMR